MNKRVNIRHWHSAHNDWLRALNFYKDEIAILSQRLTEIAGKNTSREAGAQIEHFQNQFIVCRNNIEELEHVVKLNLSRIGDEITAQSGFVDSELVNKLESERKIFLEEEKVINEVRHAFNLFCAEWM